jgi:hypothetical protein
VGLARTVVFLARHLAFAGGVQTATDVRLLKKKRFLGVLHFGLFVSGVGDAYPSYQAAQRGRS